MNSNEPIVKACGDANRTATKKGPRGTNNNLIINNIYVSPRKKRFYYNCKYLSEEITKKKKGGDRLGRETTLDRGDPTTAAPGGQQFHQYHQDDNVFSLFINHSIIMVNMHFESVIIRKLTRR